MAGAREKPLLVLGVMSGTSIDAVDYALCEVNLDHVRLLHHWQVKFPGVLRRRLDAAAAGKVSSHETAQLHHDLGRFYALHAQKGPGRVRPQLAGLHGQTVFHNPGRSNPATLQLGEPAYLAESLRVPVVNNFRPADMAAGGEGAPLATLFHRVVFAQRGRHVCVNNLGGISNVTSLDWRSGPEPGLLAFDTGPACMLMDLAMRHLTGGRRSFDEDGRWAAEGRVAETHVASWLKHPFFRRQPPKSTGRELFGEPFFRRALSQAKRLSRQDLLATLAEFTARSIALSYKLHLPGAPDMVVLAGGGASNRHLVDRLRYHLRELNAVVQVETGEEQGWPAQSVEPAAFALLAYYRWKRRAANFPGTTGARAAVLLGQISER